MTGGLHDPDCPMTNEQPEDRTACVCDRLQWEPDRRIPEGGMTTGRKQTEAGRSPSSDPLRELVESGMTYAEAEAALVGRTTSRCTVKKPGYCCRLRAGHGPVHVGPTPDGYGRWTTTPARTPSATAREQDTPA